MARRGRRLKAEAVGAVVLGAVAATGLTYLGIRSRRARVAPDSTRSNPAPESFDEPLLGYEARWRSRKDDAIETCVSAPSVRMWPQAVLCALTVTYPEVGPWTDPRGWPTWMREAATLVERDMALAAGRGTPSPPAWQVALWLQGREAIEQAAQLGPITPALIASSIYPAYTWPPANPAPWQREFWYALEALIKQRVR